MFKINMGNLVSLFAESGRTGVFKDRLGRRYRLDKGKRVPLGNVGDAGGKAPKAKKQTAPKAAPKQAKKAFTPTGHPTIDAAMGHQSVTDKAHAIYEAAKHASAPAKKVDADGADIGGMGRTERKPPIHEAFKLPSEQKKEPPAKPESQDPFGRDLDKPLMGSAAPPSKPAGKPGLDLSHVPNEPAKMETMATEALRKFESMPKPEGGDKTDVQAQMTGVMDKIGSAVKATLGVTGRAAEWAVKNTARLVGGTALAGLGLVAGIAPMAAGASVLAATGTDPATAVGSTVTGITIGPMLWPCFSLAGELFKQSGAVFSNLGKFAEGDDPTDQHLALPMEDVKALAKEIFGPLMEEAQAKGGVSDGDSNDGANSQG